MNAKELQFLEIFESFVAIDFLNDRAGLIKTMRKFMDHDYQSGVDAWEYLAATREDKIAKDERFGEIVGFELLNQFYTRAAQKCVKAISDVAAIRRAVYQYNKHSGEENAAVILIELLVGMKIAPAEEIFKVLARNERIQYGKVMKTVVDRVFVELLKKNTASMNKRMTMNKKLYELLLAYVKKIKTDERAMLEQKLKETQ